MSRFCFSNIKVYKRLKSRGKEKKKKKERTEKHRQEGKDCRAEENEKLQCNCLQRCTNGRNRRDTVERSRIQGHMKPHQAIAMAMASGSSLCHGFNNLTSLQYISFNFWYLQDSPPVNNDATGVLLRR